MERISYNIDVSVRNWKVVDFLNRGLEKCYYYLCADFDRSLTETHVSVDTDTVTIFATSSHEDYRDLYLRDVPIRQTDDYLDLELYPKEPLPKDEIRSTIDQFNDSFQSYEPVSRLFELEFQFLTGEVGDSKEEKLLEAIELSSADFDLFFDDICDRFGVTLSTDDLKASKRYLHAFQSILDFIHDIYQLGGDLATNQFNPLLSAQAYNIELSVLQTFIERKFSAMRDSQSSVADDSHREFLQRTTEFWENKYDREIDPILEKFYSDGAYHRSTAIITQI